MKTILLLATLSTALLCACLFLFIFGLVKKRKKLIFSAILVLVLFFGTAAWTGFTIVKKSVNRLQEAVAPRTGEEIYAVLFGNPGASCVNIIDHQDLVVPVIDDAIWLHFETCPVELNRILALKEYSTTKTPIAQSYGIPDGDVLEWFNPKAMADTILVFEHFSDDLRNSQTLWVSTDSTKVYSRTVFN